MYFKLNFIAIISCIVCICGAAELNETKTSVSIFYETYCPDSIKFITTKFYPAYLKLNGSYIVPHLVPAGNSNYTTVNGTTKFQCQHGEKECYGNKVHACVLSVSSSPLADQLKFINCTMSLTDPKSNATYPTDQCAKESTLKLDEITTCISNDAAADSYLIPYVNLTKQNNIKSVPFVIFNNKYSEEVSKSSVEDFDKVLCQSYINNTDTKIRDVFKCSGPNNSASTIAFSTLPVIVFTYLFSKMY